MNKKTNLFIGEIIFHVHTYRCGHASDEKDEDYVKRALQLGASAIYFTDHAPFPGDPFTGRMRYDELSEYIKGLNELKKKYEGIIDIFIGLEIEYLPSFQSYYEELKSNQKIDILMLGQHHYEVSGGIYSFSLDKGEHLYYGLQQAQLQGVSTGFFDVLAHPDRCLRFFTGDWTEEIINLERKLVEDAAYKNVVLEKNLSSMRNGSFYEDFWNIVPENTKIIYGCDAHSVKDLTLCQFGTK